MKEAKTKAAPLNRGRENRSTTETTLINQKGEVMKTTIGLDIGHSMVKAVALSSVGRTVVCFPSVVAPAIDLSDDAAARSAKKETVTFDDKTYFTGGTAVSQGAVTSVTGLTQGWIESPEHTALFLSGLERLKHAGVPDVDEALLVMGLPSEYFKHQRGTLKNIVTSMYKGEVVIQPQSAGPYYGVMFSADGVVESGRAMSKESWAVIDVGHFTSDFLLVIRGERIEVGLESVKGVHLAVDHLRRLMRDRDIEIDDLEASEALSTKTVRNYGRDEDIAPEVDQAIDLVVSRILDKADAVIASHARKLDGVILAGGGGKMIYPAIKEKWPHTTLAKDPRMAIADGFARYGRMLQRARQMVSLSQGG